METEEGFDLFAEKSAELHTMFCLAPALDALSAVEGGGSCFWYKSNVGRKDGYSSLNHAHNRHHICSPSR